MVVVAIIGGGISGLSAAYYLARSSLAQLKNSKIILLESSHRLGGWVESVKFDDGAVFEYGPHSVRSGGVTGANTLQLVSLYYSVLCVCQKNKLCFIFVFCFSRCQCCAVLV